MNETLQTIHGRFSLRLYSEREIEADVREAILAAAFRAPTAGNLQMYSVIEIEDPGIKADLAVSCDHQSFIEDAPWVTIWAADMQRWVDLFAAAEIGDARKPGPGDLMLAVSDALIAAQTAVIAAQSLGVYSCYIGDILENAEHIRALLDLPEFAFPVGMLVFGYPREGQKKRAVGRMDRQLIVHKNKYARASAEALTGMIEGADPMEEARKLYHRKFDSEFSMEMQRSVRKWLESWGV